MTIRTLLACLTTEANAPSVLSLATDLARRTDAHLIGLHTLETLFVYPGVAMHIPDSVYADFNASQARESAAIKALFEASTRAESFAAEWRELKAGAATAADRTVETARFCDLVLTTQADRDEDRPGYHQLQEQLVRESGRPVLLVPRNRPTGPLGQRILIGWSPTKEATRAVHDALKLAQPGASVTVLTVARGSDRLDMLTGELAKSLDRHGLDVTVEHRTPDGASITDCLLEVAAERGADLVVTGAFGHSRLFDFAVGAVTLELMQKADRPVLFAT